MVPANVLLEGQPGKGSWRLRCQQPSAFHCILTEAHKDLAASKGIAVGAGTIARCGTSCSGSSVGLSAQEPIPRIYAPNCITIMKYGMRWGPDGPQKAANFALSGAAGD